MMDFLLLVGGALFAMFVSGIVNYRKSVWVGLNWDDLPEAAKRYVLRLEEILEVKIHYLSTGPERSAIIFRHQ